MDATTLGALANQAAERFGNREYQYFEGKRWTYAETQVEIDRVARGLIGLGIQPGDKVSLWMTNRPEWTHIMFALAKIGAIMVPINTRLRTSDVEYIFRQSDTSTIITMEQSGPIRYLDMVLELCPELGEQDKAEISCAAFPKLKRVLSTGDQSLAGVYAWQEMLDAGDGVSAAALLEREAQVKPDDTVFIMYTSGTTGFPKGVMHCHNIIRNAIMSVDTMEITEEDCTIMYLPLFHAFGYYEGPLNCYASGSRMVLTETFDPGEILALIEGERGTIIHGFDTHWQDLMDHPDFHSRDLESLRTGILAAGLPSTVPVAERANREVCSTVTAYGMTEVMPGALMGRVNDTFEHATATSGAASEGYEVEVKDLPTGKTLPPGTNGEICVRGYAVMQGYYEKPEETAKTIDPEGWLHSGDLGVLEKDGNIRFLGRYKEMLKIGGENVDPVEVEAFFLNHEAVNKVQIVGVPDRRMSEIPVAFVVLESGKQAQAEDLAAFAKGKMASFKLPRHYLFVDEYPMTSSGKVKK
ncbi:MAG: AMP-binding protein, partial [Candidatus Hydrogenedentes bacterium]|nr:AMP-binding protein [Candidatus Hydrogenedentota bacterium]